MFKAYLEDFTEVKVIVKDNISFDENNTFLKNDDKQIFLKLNNKYNINGYNHFHFNVSEKVYPHLEYRVYLNDDMFQNLSLGKITRSNLFDQIYYFEDWLGYKYTKSYTIFRLWTPVAKEVYLILNDKKHQMKYTEKGVWEVKINGDFDKAKYHYLFRINDVFEETLDPYAKASTANNTENYVVDLKKTTKLNNGFYNGEVSYTDNIIYELSVRDATSYVDIKEKGTFKALKESINENYALGIIKKYGITHIQLLPVFTFGAVDETIIDANNEQFKYNWGYNPMEYMVLSGYYTNEPNDPYKRINEFKELVDTIHKNNMGINLDVVFNHVYDNEWFPFEKLVPGYTFRTDDRGYLTNSSWCGNDLKTDHLMIRKLIIDTLLYFQTNFNIDGFRFDLMGLIDVDTINIVRDKLIKNNKYTMIYGEGWNMNVLLPHSKKAMMENHKLLPNVAFFNDYYRNKLKTNDSILFSVDKFKKNVYNLMVSCRYYGGVFENANQTLNYIECHDNYTFYDFLQINLTNSDKIKDYQKLALSINVLSCGIPFIHAGFEFYRTKNKFDNSYNLGDDINHINWYKHDNLVGTLQDLIQIRKEYSLFRESNLEKINNQIKNDQSFDLPVIRYKLSNGDTLQVIISNNYVEVTKFLVPGSFLIFDGEKKVNIQIQELTINKPGVYIIKK